MGTGVESSVGGRDSLGTINEQHPLSQEARIRYLLHLVGLQDSDIAEFTKADQFLEEIPDVVEYGYEPSQDLSDEHQAQTANSYGNAEAAEKYSRMEWSSETVKAIWDAIFLPLLPFIKSLPPGARICLPGCGTLNAVLLFALINKDIKVEGIDLSAAMLDVGRQRLGFEIQSEVTDEEKLLIKQVLFNSIELDALLFEQGIDSWVGEVFEKISDWVNAVSLTDQEELFYLVQQIFVGEVHRRINLTQFDIAHLPADLYPLESMDLITCIAAYPHLKKTDLIPSISRMMSFLKPGGVFHLNFRADESSDTAFETEAQGQVFFDTVLGPAHPRFFNTMTIKELTTLLAQIQALFPDLEITVSYDRSPHPDSHKPGFINVFFKKNVA